MRKSTLLGDTTFNLPFLDILIHFFPKKQFLANYLEFHELTELSKPFRFWNLILPKSKLNMHKRTKAERHRHRSQEGGPAASGPCLLALRAAGFLFLLWKALIVPTLPQCWLQAQGTCPLSRDGPEDPIPMSVTHLKFLWQPQSDLEVMVSDSLWQYFPKYDPQNSPCTRCSQSST